MFYVVKEAVLYFVQDLIAADNHRNDVIQYRTIVNSVWCPLEVLTINIS